ncbi:MAG: glycosyltransferase family 1 protein [Chloroflexota bacterium]
MRVMIFCETFYPKVDGAVHMICLMTDHLKARGHDVMIVAPQLAIPPQDVVTEYKGVPVVTVGGPRFWCYPELLCAPPNIKVVRAMQDFKPDVVHLFHPSAIGMFGLLLSKLRRIPSVSSFHIDIARIIKNLGVNPFSLKLFVPAIDFLTWMVFSGSTKRLAPSRFIQQRMNSIYIRDVGLWKRGVETDRFNPRFRDDAMRERLSGDKPDHHILLYVGRLSAEKRVSDIRAVLEAVPNTTLAVLGDGADREELKAYFAGTNTVFMGHLEGEELSQAYASADIFVFPSGLETFGLVVLEAMAAGLPVVASQVGGIPDVVEEGVNGYTFPIGDVDTMIDGVRSIINEPGAWDRMAQAAYAYAQTMSWEVANDEVIDLYAQMIAQSRRL